MSLTIKKILTSIKKLWTRVNKLEEKTESSEWVTATLTDSFQNYNNSESNAPRYRKDGNFVTVEGIVSPTSEITGSATQNTIFTLPEGHRPSRNKYCICQGTTRAIWLLTVSTAGVVYFSRYGTSAYESASTSVWLPFTFTFPID